MFRDDSTEGKELTIKIIGEYKQVILDGTRTKDVYIAEWALELLSTLLTVNRGTVAYRFKKFFEQTLFTDEVQNTLVSNARRILKQGMSTVYYPVDIKINRAKKSIKISGTYITLFSQDKKQETDVKSYLLSYVIRANGLTLISSLEEIANEDVNQ